MTNIEYQYLDPPKCNSVDNIDVSCKFLLMYHVTGINIKKAS